LVYNPFAAASLSVIDFPNATTCEVTIDTQKITGTMAWTGGSSYAGILNPTTPTPTPTPTPPTPTPTPTPIPTSQPGAKTVVVTTVKQELTVTSVKTVAAYSGDTKQTFETGYAISIKIWDALIKAIIEGNEVKSEASAARRAGIKIAFEATVQEAQATEAKALAKALDPVAMVAAISKAATQLDLNVTIPSAADLTVEQPEVTEKTVTVPGSWGASSSGGSSVIIIVIIVAVVLVLAAGGVAAYFVLGRKKAASASANKAKDIEEDDFDSPLPAMHSHIAMGSVGVLPGHAQEEADIEPLSPAARAIKKAAARSVRE